MQQTPTISSRLEVLTVLTHADELPAFGCHRSSVQLLAEYLADATSSQQRRRMLLLEHSLLPRLSAAVTNALRLIGQGPGLAETTIHTLESIYLLCIHANDFMVNTHEAAGLKLQPLLAAVSGEWALVACGTLVLC